MILIDDYPVDAALTESHKYTADVTSYKTESGSTKTDNVQSKPLEVNIEGVISDSPLAQVLAARRARNLADPAFEAASPAAEGFDKLVTLMSDRSRGGVSIETSLKVYPNMILTNFEPKVDAKSGKALRFTATFQQISIVTNLRTRVRVASPATPSGKTKTSGPPVVVVNRPSVDDENITTLSGRPASWNDEHGRYEYASDEASDGGAPVPARDLGDFTKYNNASRPVTEEDAQEFNADGTPLNDTYFDSQDDRWKNTDGSPVTQKQIKNKTDGGILNRGNPWYDKADVHELAPGD